MSIIATTNSTCSIKKIEYRGAQAMVHLKITAFAKTIPSKGVIIGFKDSGNETFQPSFKVSSEDDVYQSKIFWINYSNLSEHTNQNIGMDCIIPVPIDLSKGTYKDKHLYREVTVLLVDYQDESKILWSSPILHLCSGPIHFNIVGDIIPQFTKLQSASADSLYKLDIRYTFTEDSWLFNLQHPDLTLEMSVHANQNTPFDVLESVLATSSGTWENVTSELEPSAHVTITAKLKLNNIILWKDQIVCVPNEVATLYIKQDNTVYLVEHKAVMKNNLPRDAHVYHGLEEPHELFLVIIPRRDINNNFIKDTNGRILYTLEPCIKTISGKYTSVTELLKNIQLDILSVALTTGEALYIPQNLLGDIKEDFPTVLYNNYSVEDAQDILTKFVTSEGYSFKILLHGITAVKQPILICSPEIFPGNLVVMEGENPNV